MRVTRSAPHVYTHSGVDCHPCPALPARTHPWPPPSPSGPRPSTPPYLHRPVPRRRLLLRAAQPAGPVGGQQLALRRRPPARLLQPRLPLAVDLELASRGLALELVCKRGGLAIQKL
jgi:hypothetical protein